mgnify:CR=1 FL=1
MGVWRAIYSILLHAAHSARAVAAAVAGTPPARLSASYPGTVWLLRNTNPGTRDLAAYGVGGRTRAAEPLIAALRARWPDHRVLLTHMTPNRPRDRGAGFRRVKCSRCYLPYDLPVAVGRFLSHFQPRLGLLLETEIWPNLIHACRVRSIPLYLVNARLSERSAQGYARFAGLHTRNAAGARGRGGANRDRRETVDLNSAPRMCASAGISSSTARRGRKT